MIKIVLSLVKNVFFGLNWGISEKLGQVAQKHTAVSSTVFLMIYKNTFLNKSLILFDVQMAC